MKLRTAIVIFVATIIVPTYTTYREYLQKLVTIPLPYYPTLFKFKGYEFDSNFNRPQNSANFYFCSSKEGEKNDSLAYGYIENNPARSLLNVVHEPRGVACETAMINEEPDQVHPCFNSSIKHLSTATTYPLFVTEKNPNIVCYIENIITATYQKLLATEPLKDVVGDVSAGILGLALGTTGTIENNQSTYVFAAVEDSKGLWGDASASGIAVIKYDRKVEEVLTKDYDGKEKTEKKIDYCFNVLDAATGTSFGNKAVALDQSVISINGGSYSIDSKAVDMYWNPYLGRLYIALHVKNSFDCSETQGSRALLIGRIDAQQRLVFDPIMPDCLCRGSDKIIGACGPGVGSSIHKVRTMCTSTGYIYLILVGGVGEPHQTDKEVYALPLTDKGVIQTIQESSEDRSKGTIASKHSSIDNKYFERRLFGRAMHNEVDSLEDVVTKYDRETQVGAGKELPSLITDMIIEGDVVYVTCAQAGCGQQPGIFHSQAILDKEGKIAAWTPWQRIAGVQEGVAKAMINTEQFFIAYLKSEKPEVVCQITQNIPPNKERVDAEKEKGDLADLLNEQFKRDRGGIHGLFDFSTTNPLCGNNNLVSLLVATGYKKIVLVETGNLNNEAIFTAFKEGFTTNISTNNNGSITPVTEPQDISKPNVLVVEGGVLDEIGSITEAVVVHDEVQAWLIVAGMKGAAILAADDGSGIARDPGILPHFAGIQKNYSFKKIGNWNGIKKLAADEQFLFVLTKNKLERIAISQEVVQEATLQKGSVVIEIAPQEGCFFDVGVSGPLCLLATSKGLLVNAAGKDCRTDVYGSMQWNQIVLPHAKGAVYRLFFVTATGQKNGFCHSGQVYVSTGSLLENMTRVYRLYVNDISKHGITDTTVQLLQDHRYFDKGLMPLFTFTNFRDHFATDGVHYFSARSRQMHEKPFMDVVSLPHIKNYRVVEPNLFSVIINIGKKTKNVSALVQNSATGNWLLAGDFGLRIHN